MITKQQIQNYLEACKMRCNKKDIEQANVVVDKEFEQINFKKYGTK